MNKTHRIAVLAVSLAAFGSAFADDITIDTAEHRSLKSRAEVQAELSAFKKAGVNPWSTSYNQFRGMQVVKTRDEVRAEVIAAREAGELNAQVGEDSGAMHRASGARQSGLQLAGVAK